MTWNTTRVAKSGYEIVELDVNGGFEKINDLEIDSKP